MSHYEPADGTGGGDATLANQTTIIGYIDDLETRLTAARGGYLDELAAANIPADVDTLKQRSVTHVSMMEFWSTVDDIITLTTATADVDLPNVVVANIPANSTILRVVGMFKCRAFNNTAQAINAINGAGVINVKKSTGAYGVDDVALIIIADNIWSTSASTKEGGMLIEGTNNASAEVDGNATYNLRFDGNIFVDAANLELIDAIVGLKVYFIAT